MNYMGQAGERDTYANALSGLFLKPGESATFTLPDDGTDTYYLLWVVSTDLDTGDIRWQYSEFRNVEPTATVDTVTGFTDQAQLQGYDAAADSGSLSAYADGDSVSDWAAEAMAWAVDAGVLNGKDGGRLDPQGQLTRAEAAQILTNLIQVLQTA